MLAVASDFNAAGSAPVSAAATGSVPDGAGDDVGAPTNTGRAVSPRASPTATEEATGDVRCIGPYPPLVDGAHRLVSHRDSR